jgi:hypothetical protein
VQERYMAKAATSAAKKPGRFEGEEGTGHEGWL